MSDSQSKSKGEGSELTTGQPKMSWKMRLFVQYMIDDLTDPVEAARKAGYAESSLSSKPFQLLTRKDVIAALEEARAIRGARHSISADRVIVELARIAMVNLEDVPLTPKGIPVITAGDKIRALDSLSKILGITAETLNVHHQISTAPVIELVPATSEHAKDIDIEYMTEDELDVKDDD